MKVANRTLRRDRGFDQKQRFDLRKSRRDRASIDPLQGDIASLQ